MGNPEVCGVLVRELRHMGNPEVCGVLVRELRHMGNPEVCGVLVAEFYRVIFSKTFNKSGSGQQ